MSRTQNPSVGTSDAELVVVKLQSVQRGKRADVFLANRYRIGTIVKEDPLIFNINGEWIRAERVTVVAAYWRLARDAYKTRQLLRTLAERRPPEFYHIDDVRKFLERFRRQPAPDRAPKRRRQFPEEMPELRTTHPCSGIYRDRRRRVLEAWFVDERSERLVGACRIDTPQGLRVEWCLRMLRHVFWLRFHTTCPYCVDAFVKTCTAVKDFNTFL